MDGIFRILATGIVILGGYLAVFDIGMMTAASPYIVGYFEVSKVEGIWVMAAYTVASTSFALVLIVGISRFVGVFRVYKYGLILFVVGSLGCALQEESFGWFLFFRALQGIGGAPLIGLSEILVTKMWRPGKRKGALMFWGLGMLSAPILGSVIGSWIVYEWHWQWVFLFYLPIAFLLLFWMFALREDLPKDNRVKGPFDFLGALFLPLTLASLVLILNFGHDLNWLKDTRILLLAVIFLVSLGALILWEINCSYSLIDFSLFKSRNFVISIICVFFLEISMHGSSVLIPHWLLTSLNFDIYHANLAMLPQCFGLIIVIFISMIIFRVDLRKIVAIGAIGFGLSILFTTKYAVDVSLEEIAWSRVLPGIFLPLIFIPLIILPITNLPFERISHAMGLFNLTRGIGLLFGVMFASSFSASYTAISRNHLVSFVHEGNNSFKELVQNIGNEFALSVINKQIDIAASTQGIINTEILFALFVFIIFVSILFAKKFSFR